MDSKLLHFADQVIAPLVPADPDAEDSPSGLYFEHDQLKPTRCLHKPFAPNMHPFNVLETDDTLPIPVVENQPVLVDDQFPVTKPVHDQPDEGDGEKQDHDVKDRIPVNHSELVFHKISADSCVEKQRKEIDKCLLVIEIEFVFECFFHRRCAAETKPNDYFKSGRFLLGDDFHDSFRNDAGGLRAAQAFGRNRHAALFLRIVKERTNLLRKP